MQSDRLIASLQRFPQILQSVVESLDETGWQFKSDPKDWCILEIVCHLRDEEVEDFRARLQSTILDPAQPWPSIDPEQIAIDREYMKADPDTALKEFLRERSHSLEWLHSLPSVDWEVGYLHPKIGPIPAGQLLGSWVAHDLLHLRQITKRLFELAHIDAAPFPLDYAGTW